MNFRKASAESLEHVQLCVERVGRVHVVIVTAAPEKSFTFGHDLDIGRIDAVTLENVPFGLAEITANHADRIHLREKAGRKRKMRRRTTQDLLAFTEWRFQCIERDRTNYC